jgi:chemotaxis protein MotB
MKPIILLILAGAAVGCVSQAKYEDLKERYDLAQLQLADRQERVGQLGASFQESQQNVQRLKGENARVQTQLAKLQEERTSLEKEQHRLTLEMTQLLEDSSRLKESTEKLGRALAEVTRRKVEADRRVAEFRKLLEQFKSLIDAGTLKVAVTDGRMVLQLPSDVLFDSGSAKLSSAGKVAIQEVARVLKQEPGRRYQIEGHTDNVPIHNQAFRSNWELASARGLGVVRAMIEGGIDSALVSAASYGEFHPVASNDVEDGRHANRRIEIIVVPDLSLLPGYEELQDIVQ